MGFFQGLPEKWLLASLLLTRLSNVFVPLVGCPRGRLPEICISYAVAFSSPRDRLSYGALLRYLAFKKIKASRYGDVNKSVATVRLTDLEISDFVKFSGDLMVLTFRATGINTSLKFSHTSSTNDFSKKILSDYFRCVKTKLWSKFRNFLEIIFYCIKNKTCLLIFKNISDRGGRNKLESGSRFLLAWHNIYKKNCAISGNNDIPFFQNHLSPKMKET